MLGLIIGFLSSFITTLVIIRYKKLHQKFTADHDLTGPQKFHLIAVPRIGGIGIAVGIFFSILIHAETSENRSLELILLLTCTPVFAIGLTEDITKAVSVKMRLLITALGAALAIYLTHGQITNLDIPIVDLLLSIPGFAFLFTVFAITGLSNAYNIIDGFNGLSSMVGIISLLGLGYVSYKVGDASLLHLNLAMMVAILGFFLWNYPRGLIFLGDGGAYLIGYWVALMSVLVVQRHPEISPWFAVLINAYPILETLFTIYRRKIHQRKSPGLPDGIHFHTLIYRRILKPKISSQKESSFSANARTSPYLWFLSFLAIAPAVLFWHSTPILILSIAIFTISYVWLYKSIVTFRTPRWMHI
jgi:UDP-GlcNAc:undecaprenyl-phosphate/decaprenyl-phosphate GlcNAc-1-phosphate transferase